jgi:hypothetical protein
VKLIGNELPFERLERARGKHMGNAIGPLLALLAHLVMIQTWPLSEEVRACSQAWSDDFQFLSGFEPKGR